MADIEKSNARDGSPAEETPAGSPLDRERKGFSFLAPIEDEIKERAKEDPFARFLLEGWRQVFWIVVAVFAIFYIKNAYVKNQQTNQQYSADRFVQVRNEMERMDAARIKAGDEEKKEGEKPAESKEDAAKRVSEGLRALQDAKDPYNQLEPLYAALLNAKTGGKVVDTVNPSQLPAAGDAVGRMIAEFQLLVNARAKLGSPDTIADGKALLKRLAAEGIYVNIDAAISVARLARSPEERAEAMSILQDIENRQPEQAKLLGPELQRLGGKASAS